ncbi:MAG: redoxin domain-containing protein [Anaerolineae bacterium]|nr:redoxin domain-containing protein [Anaerolineae bacterium]
MTVASRRRGLVALAAVLLLVGPLGCGRPSIASPSPVPATPRPVRTPTPCDKCGKERPRPTPTRVRGTKVGQEAPDLDLRDTAGRMVRLSDYRGSIVLLNFWATWCATCCQVPLQRIRSSGSSSRSWRPDMLLASRSAGPRERPWQR